MPLFQKQGPFSGRYGRFSEALENLKKGHLYRSFLKSEKKVLFSSNDYLGLSQHPVILASVHKALDRFGFGSGSARTFSTHLPVYQELEELLADTLDKKRALIFSSGYQLNSTLLKALAKEETLFFLDKYAHRSLLEGAQNSGGKVIRFKHNDLDHLEELLKKYRGEGKEAWIVTESLFSMHGTRANIPALIQLKDRFDTFLIVDEAHTIGVFDFKRDGIDLIVGGFGKALGGFGGFVAGDPILIDYLLNVSPGFLFTTALPPAIVAGLMEAVKLIPSLNLERERLHKNGSLLRQELGLGPGDYIVPYPVASPEIALKLSQTLRGAGFEVPAVRPPTVPPKGSLLRLSVTAQHTNEELKAVARVIKKGWDPS